VPGFGVGAAQWVPSAVLADRGRYFVVGGGLDVELALRVLDPSRTTDAARFPVLVGPPAVGPTSGRVFLATNDDRLNPPDAKGVRSFSANPLAFRIAYAKPGRVR
jgi:hypothetical protein